MNNQITVEQQKAIVRQAAKVERAAGQIQSQYVYAVVNGVVEMIKR